MLDLPEDATSIYFGILLTGLSPVELNNRSFGIVGCDTLTNGGGLTDRNVGKSDKFDVRRLTDQNSESFNDRSSRIALNRKVVDVRIIPESLRILLDRKKKEVGSANQPFGIVAPVVPSQPVTSDDFDQLRRT